MKGSRLLLDGMVAKRSEEERAAGGAWATFRADLRTGWAELVKRTSRAHARWVLVVIAVGAILRLSQLWQDITYDEALAYTLYGTRSTGFILSNYVHPSNHILHTVLSRWSTELFGVHLWSLRLPAFLAGVLVLPLFYVFTRAMFNRYIALLALAMAAGSGVLVGYSALARGYSFTWLFLVAGWLAGRYHAKTGNAVGGVLVAVANALGMWAVPTMLFGALACYAWLALYLVASYRSSLGRRTAQLGLSFALFILLTLAAYAPVVSAHSLDHLLHHPALGEATWSGFLGAHQDSSFALWAFINDAGHALLSLIGFVGVVYAAWVSSKYRIMLVALLLGAVPLTILRMAVAPPQVWSYILFNLHISSGIALFYLLKVVQERVFTGFGKRTRTVVGAGAMLALMGGLGLYGIQGRVPRFKDAHEAADFLNGLVRPGDRVLMEHPNEAAFTFYVLADGMDAQLVAPTAGESGRQYALVGPADGQTLASVLKHNGLAAADTVRFKLMKDWKRLELWGPR